MNKRVKYWVRIFSVQSYSNRFKYPTNGMFTLGVCWLDRLVIIQQFKSIYKLWIKKVIYVLFEITNIDPISNKVKTISREEAIVYFYVMTFCYIKVLKGKLYKMWTLNNMNWWKTKPSCSLFVVVDCGF